MQFHSLAKCRHFFAACRGSVKRMDAYAAWPLLMLVRGYRLLLSPSLGSSCRFTPTCSAYALQALQSHGAMRGSYLAAKRVLRCHPLCAGGHDPVPPRA